MNRPKSTDRETEWSKWLAIKMGGKAEARTFCGARCDVLTDTHAWEVEWMKKYNEAPGQAILYAALFNKKPGIILLSKGEDRDSIYYLRCAVVCKSAGIDLQVVETDNKEQDKIGLADVIKRGWSKILGGK
tara:strand:+ start:284 stop:676 length:393 start_codon:yes stop_codon:yes gene_type:complete